MNKDKWEILKEWVESLPIDDSLDIIPECIYNDYGDAGIKKKAILEKMKELEGVENEKDKLIYENDYTEQKITIYKNDKKIIFELIWLNDNDYYVFTLKELQAINKQVLERGDIDEC